MRAEERELEGQDLEREQGLEEEVAHEEELPVLAGDEVRDLELAHRSVLFDALRLVLDGAQINISTLYLPARETAALEALRTAVEGHDSVGEFVFAEDRSALFEQALAVLQQNVTHSDPAQLAELHAKFDAMTERVATLREQLLNLSDAQEEIFHEYRPVAKTAEDETEDKPAEAEAATEPAVEGEAKPSTLVGEALPEREPVPTTTGFEDDDKRPWWSKPFG